MNVTITVIIVIEFWGRGGISLNDSDSIQRTVQSGSVFVGNTSPSEVGMSGNCHFSGGVNPNKDKRNKIAIPVLTPDRPKRQMGRRFKTDGEPSFTLTGMDRHGVAVDIEPIGVVDDQGRLRGAKDESNSPHTQKRISRESSKSNWCFDKTLGVLQNVRSEYGKQIRKDYESGKINISRHDFLEHRIREDGVTNTLSTVLKDNYLTIKIKEATKQGYAIARGGRDSINLAVPTSKTRRGRVGRDMANTLDTSCNQGIFVEISPELTVYAVYYPPKDCYIAIRKLTPKECFRLQGFTDDYFEKAAFVNSDSQLYKQAGNAMTVDVVKAVGDAIIKYEDKQ